MRIANCEMRIEEVPPIRISQFAIRNLSLEPVPDSQLENTRRENRCRGYGAARCRRGLQEGWTVGRHLAEHRVGIEGVIQIEHSLDSLFIADLDDLRNAVVPQFSLSGSDRSGLQPLIVTVEFAAFLICADRPYHAPL